MRRRMWHHLVLLDTLCVEHEGAESMLSNTAYDTALPQCSNDANWDACEFAIEGPTPSTEFTEMTGALVQYEIASAVRALLDHNMVISNIETSLRYQREVVLQASRRIETIYLNNLDLAQPTHKIINDLTALSFERMFFAIHQPLFKHGIGGEFAASELQTELVIYSSAEREGLLTATFLRLFDRAIAYCETVQRLREEFVPYHLDWIFVRAFSWDSVTLMLKGVIRNHALDQSEQGKRARARIDILFQNRHTIDHLAGNGNLWVPLQRLWEELKALEDNDNVQEQGGAIRDEWPIQSANVDGNYSFSLE